MTSTTELLPSLLARARSGGAAIWPGVLVAVVIAAAVHVVLRSQAVVPEVVAALALGVLAGNLGLRPWSAAGARFVVRYGLRLAIIALGAGLDLGVIGARGWSTLFLIVVLVVVAMSLGLMLGRAAGLERPVSILLGVGTAICGASAILAVSPLIRARDRETAYAITTIFAFNVVALITLPFIAHELGLSQVRFGTWVGTAVNDTSVVVATGYIYGSNAGGVATLVKLTRTLLLVPLSIFVGLAYGPPGEGRTSIVRRASRNLPWFVLGFFALAILNTTHTMPPLWTRVVAQGGSLLLIVVLAAVGLGVNIGGIRQMGLKPLVIGFILAAAMATISISLITALRI